MDYKWVILSKSDNFKQTHSFIQLFVGFQKIIKLLKLGKRNMNYKGFKSICLYIKVRVLMTRNGQNMDPYIPKDPTYK